MCINLVAKKNEPTRPSNSSEAGALGEARRGGVEAEAASTNASTASAIPGAIGGGPNGPQVRPPNGAGNLDLV